MNLTDQAFSGLPTGKQILPILSETHKPSTSSDIPGVPYKIAAQGLDNLIRKTAANASAVSNQ